MAEYTQQVLSGPSNTVENLTMSDLNSYNFHLITVICGCLIVMSLGFLVGLFFLRTFQNAEGDLEAGSSTLRLV